jgi:hypothetical protein
LTSTAIRRAPGTSPRSSSNRFATLARQEIDPCQVAAGASKARDKTQLDRVFGNYESDRDGRGCGLGCQCRWDSACGNHRHAAANQIGRQFRQAIILIVGPAVFDGNVLALDEGRFF